MRNIPHKRVHRGQGEDYIMGLSRPTAGNLAHGIQGMRRLWHQTNTGFDRDEIGMGRSIFELIGYEGHTGTSLIWVNYD